MNGVGVAVLVLALLGGSLWVFTRRIARDVEARVPKIGQHVRVTGAVLHYVDRGTESAGKPPIVMLHGLGGQLFHFHYALVEDLARDTRVIAVDRPGSGYSTRETGKATTLEDQADAIVALLDQLGITRAVFVGHSLGGALSLTIATRHPQRVAGLTLIAPLTHLVARPHPVFRGLAVKSHSARRLIASLLATPLFLLGRERVMPQIFGPERIPSGYATRGGGLLTLRPSQYMGASQDLGEVARILPGIEARYEEFNRHDTPPIDVLYGREDRILDYRVQGEAFAKRVPACRLTLVNGGHMLPLTQPSVCAEVIRATLARASA